MDSSTRMMCRLKQVFSSPTLFAYTKEKKHKKSIVASLKCPYIYTYFGSLKKSSPDHCLNTGNLTRRMLTLFHRKRFRQSSWPEILIPFRLLHGTNNIGKRWETLRRFVLEFLGESNVDLLLPVITCSIFRMCATWMYKTLSGAPCSNRMTLSGFTRYLPRGILIKCSTGTAKGARYIYFMRGGLPSGMPHKYEATKDSTHLSNLLSDQCQQPSSEPIQCPLFV